MPARNPKSKTKTVAAAPTKKAPSANPLFPSTPRNLRVGGDIRVMHMPHALSLTHALLCES
jgi:hypothetical protein